MKLHFLYSIRQKSLLALAHYKTHVAVGVLGFNTVRTTGGCQYFGETYCLRLYGSWTLCFS
jgi:hypothetical protein